MIYQRKPFDFLKMKNSDVRIIIDEAFIWTIMSYNLDREQVHVIIIGTNNIRMPWLGVHEPRQIIALFQKLVDFGCPFFFFNKRNQ